MTNHLSGASLAGSSPTRKRASDDFYATPFSATEQLFQHIQLTGSVLEPACGQGHISKIIADHFPNVEITSTDLVQREDLFHLNIQGGIDFLTHDYGRMFDTVITNPPFKLSQEFIERALTLSNRYVIMFAKIQLLEGTKRRALFDTHPPKYIYVFSKRVSPLNNGSAVDENGKPWATTMCFAWFVWEKGYTGEPMIRWL